MRILVTGATGFIGLNLVRRLVPKGHEIVCLARKSADVSRLKDLPVSLSFCEVLDESGVDKVFRAFRPEAVFHCAAAVEARDERELRRVNVGSTRNICEACLKYGTGRLIYASSIAVVNGNEGPVLNDSMPYKANCAYGWSKVAAELVVYEYREKGLKTAIIRPCMVYGEEEPHALGRILYLANRRLLFLPDIPEADSTLHLAYVGNVAQIMETALYDDRALEGTYIVADREYTTVRGFFNALYRELGAGAPPVIPRWAMSIAFIVPAVRNKVKRLFRERVYDISRAERLLGYKPEVSLEEGLRRTVFAWKKPGSAGHSDPKTEVDKQVDLCPR